MGTELKVDSEEICKLEVKNKVPNYFLPSETSSSASLEGTEKDRFSSISTNIYMEAICCWY